jgi:integrase
MVSEPHMTTAEKVEATEKPQPRSLPFTRWPEADQAAWNAACRPAARLKRGGAAGHLKPVTRDTYAWRYGYFLGFVDRQGLLVRDASAAANVIPENIDAYLAEARRHLGSVTIAHFIYALRSVAQFIAPSRDFSWLAEIGKDLAFVACPRSKFDRVVSTDILVEAGLTLIREAEISTNLSPLGRARQVRNGLMVAMLALHPIRRKNYAALEIGRSFVKIRDQWWIVLSASETKEKRADERPINELLTPFIERYIRQHRPVLARSDNPPQALWLSAHDDAPMSPMTPLHVGKVIGDTTFSTTGVRVNPHMFRTCGASTAATLGGDNPYLGSALLHHRDPRTTADYNRATTLTAAESFRQIVRQYEKPA